MDWDDLFRYGKWCTWTVRNVWTRNPSYLVWTCCYTKRTFSERVMKEIEKYVARGPHEGLTPILVQRFNERSGGPW